MRKLVMMTAVLVMVSVTGMHADKFKLKEGKIYKSGTLFSGTYTVYGKAGNRESTFEIMNGVENGKVVHYYEDQTIRETGLYADGLKDGTWVKWNSEGKKVGIASYNNGLKNGTWKIWDENGNLRSEMHYADGERTGTWKMWDDNGALISEKAY